MRKQNIVIRPAKVEDAEQYLKLKNLVWRNAYRNIFPEIVFDRQDANVEKMAQTFSKFCLGDGKFCYVAEDDGKIIGLVNAKLKSMNEYFADQNYADLEAIYIHPDYQHEGLGSKFKNMFINWAKENGAEKFVIGVLKENTPARKVYESWGGKLDKFSRCFTKENKEYEEVYYTYEI